MVKGGSSVKSLYEEGKKELEKLVEDYGLDYIGKPYERYLEESGQYEIHVNVEGTGNECILGGLEYDEIGSLLIGMVQHYENLNYEE